MEHRQVEAAVDFIDPWLESQVRRTDLPGLSVALAYQGEIIFSGAYGHADIENDESFTTDHLVRAASQAKMVTATGIMQLAEAGHLELNDRAGSYLPWLAKHSDDRVPQVTIKELLSHDANIIRDGLDASHWVGDHAFPDAEQLREIVLHSKFNTNRTRLNYSNIGYALLGQVIETVAQQSYANYVAEHIAKPLDLTDTLKADYTPDLAHRMTIGYGYHDNELFTLLTADGEPHIPIRALAPAAGLCATPAALCMFMAAHRAGDERLLSDQSKQMMQRLCGTLYDRTSYGLGMMRIGSEQVELVGHAGNVLGHRSATLMDARNDMIASVAFNLTDYLASPLHIVECLHRVTQNFQNTVVQTLPHDYKKYVGEFLNPLGADGFRIAPVAGRLTLTFGRSWQPLKDASELREIIPGVFEIAAGGGGEAGEILEYTDFGPDGHARAIRCMGYPSVVLEGFCDRFGGILRKVVK